MSTFLKVVLKLLGVAICSFILAVIAGGLITEQKVAFTKEIMTNSLTLGIFGLLILLYFVYLLNESTKGRNPLLGTKKVKEDNNKQFFDSKFLTTKELNGITTFAT